MSGIISREDADSARPWQPPEMRASSEPAPPEASRRAGNPPTTQQYEAIYASAETQGREDGRAAGLAQGHEEGYAAGLAQGLEAGRAQAQAEHDAIRALLERLAQPVREIDAETGTALVALALEVARQVVMHETRTQPEALVDVVRQALAAFPARGGVPWVRLNPADVDVVRQIAGNLDAGGVTLVADDGLHRGDVVIASPAPGQTATPDRRWHSRGRDALSELDLRLEERWRQVMSRLFEEGLQ
jgi:flagellar assembly protein FliH